MADAVRLIDGEGPHIEADQKLLKALRYQPLRRDEEQSQLPRARRAHQLPFLYLGGRAIDLTCVDAKVAKRVHLILHQRDQRRYDHRQISGQ